MIIAEERSELICGCVTENMEQKTKSYFAFIKILVVYFSYFGENFSILLLTWQQVNLM